MDWFWAAVAGLAIVGWIRSHFEHVREHTLLDGEITQIKVRLRTLESRTSVRRF